MGPETTVRESERGYLCVGAELVGPTGDDDRGHHFDLCLGDERGTGLARQAGADHVGMGRGARGAWVRLWRAEAPWMATAVLCWREGRSEWVRGGKGKGKGGPRGVVAGRKMGGGLTRWV